MRTLTFLLVAALAVPAAAAGGGLSADQQTLYLIRGTSDYASTADPDNHGEGGFWGSAVEGVVGSPYTGNGREWVFPFMDELNGTVLLDGNGTVAASLWIGGGTGEGGQHDVGWEIKNGGKVVASGAPQTVLFTGPEGPKELTWQSAPKVDRIENTTLSVRVYTENGHGSGIRISLGDGEGGGMRSHLVLPVEGVSVPAGPADDEPPADEEAPAPAWLVPLGLAVVLAMRRRA